MVSRGEGEGAPGLGLAMIVSPSIIWFSRGLFSIGMCFFLCWVKWSGVCMRNLTDGSDRNFETDFEYLCFCYVMLCYVV